MREDMILRRKYGFSLCILPTRLIESEIDFGKIPKEYCGIKAEIDNENDPSFQHYEELIQKR